MGQWRGRSDREDTAEWRVSKKPHPPSLNSSIPSNRQPLHVLSLYHQVGLLVRMRRVCNMLVYCGKKRRRDSSQISLSVSGLAMASATSRVTACLSAPPNLIDASHARYVVLPRSAVHHTHSTTCIGATPYNLVKHLEGWIHGKWVPFTEFDAE